MKSAEHAAELAYWLDPGWLPGHVQLPRDELVADAFYVGEKVKVSRRKANRGHRVCSRPAYAKSIAVPTCPAP